MKRLVIFFVLMSMTCLLFGCAGSNSDGSSSSNQTATTQLADVGSPETSTRMVTDMVGRTVEIPTKVERIVPLANAPRMITYLGIANKAVAISGFNKDTVKPGTAYAYASKKYWADLPIVGTDGGGATDYYPEQIIAANPDIILCSYDKEQIGRASCRERG